MKINPQGSQPNLPVSKTASAGSTAAGVQRELSQGGAAEVEGLRLAQLVLALKSEAGDREAAINQARAKVQSGAYLTSAGAAAAANGILGL
jgi:hypothetical protein